MIYCVERYIFLSCTPQFISMHRIITILVICSDGVVVLENGGKTNVLRQSGW